MSEGTYWYGRTVHQRMVPRSQLALPEKEEGKRLKGLWRRLPFHCGLDGGGCIKHSIGTTTTAQPTSGCRRFRETGAVPTCALATSSTKLSALAAVAFLGSPSPSPPSFLCHNAAAAAATKQYHIHSSPRNESGWRGGGPREREKKEHIPRGGGGRGRMLLF